MARPVEVRITGDSRSAVSAIDRTDSSLRGLSQTARKADSGLGGLKRGLAGIGAAVAGLGLLREGVGLIKESVGLASNLAESTSKVGVIFGKSAGGITSWAKTTTAAMSMSQTAILDTVAGFDLLLTNKGLGQKQATEWSKNLTSLSADLSSFFNVSAQEAAGALTSALKGEMDPIEKFGVSLDEATLKARAYSMGLYSGKGALSATAKAQAAYKEILEQTEQAQGDLVRTQGGAANQMRLFQNNIEGLKTTLGTAFTPLIEKYLPGVNEWLSKLNTQDFADKLGASLLKMGDFIATKVLPKVKELAERLKEAFSGVNNDEIKSSIEDLGPAIQAIADAGSSMLSGFNNLSPEAKKNLALIVAAGAAFAVAKRNPVVRIGVDLVAGVVTTIASSFASSLVGKLFPDSVKISGTPRVYVTNMPVGGPDGGGPGPSGGRGRGVQVGLGIAAVAAAVLPFIIDRLPLSQAFKDSVSQISEGVMAGSSVAWVAAALGVPNPIAWAAGIVAGVAWLSKRAQDNQTAWAHQDYVNNGVAGEMRTVKTGLYGLDRQQAKTEKDVIAETKGRRAADEREALRRSHADISEAERRLFADRSEADKRRNADAHLARQVAEITADMATVRAYFSKVERLVSENQAAPASLALRTRQAPTMVQNFSINVSGAGSPAVTAREIDRYVRRSGDPRLVSVTA